jgi:XTP/dITP diphosphohydrolase
MQKKTSLPAKLLIATYNRGKLAEMQQLLAGLDLPLGSLDEIAGIVEVEETGSTIAENAELKASKYSSQSGLWSLADDSGIEVDALNGAPGVHSDRFAGEGASDEVKMQKLLDELSRVPGAPRTAHFTCVMALSDPSGKLIQTVTGNCPGTIASRPRGRNGFGYDPIFVPDGYELTFGELDARIKQQISHRAKAAAKIMRYLQGFFGV